MAKQVELSKRTLNPGERLTLVVDIEGTGYEQNLQPVLSIGWVVCARINFDDTEPVKEEIFEKGRVSFKPEAYSRSESNRVRHFGIGKNPNFVIQNGYIFGRNCWEDFWMRQSPRLLPTLMNEAFPPEDAISLFLSIENRWPIGEVMSDNPSYDLTRIDFAIERYSNRNYGMHCTREGKYRLVSDPSEIYHYLPLKIRSKIMPEIPTHFPDDDALDIYRFALKIKNAVNEWGKQ